MLVASPVRAIAGALLVSVLFGPWGETGTPRERAQETHTLAAPEKHRGPPLGPAVAWAEALEPVLVKCANTRVEARVRLYRPDGMIDPDAVDTFVLTASDGDDGGEAQALNLRTMQLVMKAAYHFKAKSLEIVSAYRPGKGPHSAGDAIDFRIPGVWAGTLAAYLRTMGRAGVGVYTHPQTQYVHLDAREQSFHWLDASPPGKTWREKQLGDSKRDQRDAEWAPEQDLPIEPPRK